MIARVLVVFLVVCLVSPAAAWDRHETITREVLKTFPVPGDSLEVTITPMDYDISSVINPAYTFPFKEGEPGETTDAATILAVYCDEPDWGMDQNLRVSKEQIFMGGYTGPMSQGYFHMYYPFGSLHAPLPVKPMGGAPARAAWAYSLAREASARGDLYWTLRFGAWCLHYLQDLCQPYHTTQTSRLFVDLLHPIKGTTFITANYHAAYEAFVRFHLESPEGEPIGDAFREALGDPMYSAPAEMEKFARQVALWSHEMSGKLFRASRKYFGDKFHRPYEVRWTTFDLIKPYPQKAREELVSTTAEALRLCGRVTRSLLAALAHEVRQARRARLYRRLHGEDEE